MIDITGVDLKQFVKDVYDLSRPQGMGFLHFTPEPLSDEDAENIIQNNRSGLEISMDYVHGRACKMYISTKDGKQTIDSRWFDHSERDLDELLSRHGIEAGERK